MKGFYFALSLSLLQIFVGCSESQHFAADEEATFGPDLHPGETIEIRPSSDGLERTVKIYNEAWLGDRYSDPKFSCEASSIERLFSFAAEYSGTPDVVVHGAANLPDGTYLYSFGDTTWKNEAAIFDDLVKATEEAFSLRIDATSAGGKRARAIHRRGQPEE
jgi:hypothetical protein